MGTHRSDSADRRARSTPPSGNLLSKQAIRVRTPQTTSSLTTAKQPLPQSPVKRTKRSPQSALAKPQVVPAKTDKRSIWKYFWAIVLVLGAASGVVGLGWISVQLIVNPQSLSWVNRFVPGWSNHPLQEEPAKSLEKIRSELQQKGLIPGDLIPLGKSLSFQDGRSSTTDVLLPVRQTRPNCQTLCDRLVELRVYQTAPDPSQKVDSGDEYYLVGQLPISGVEESFAIAPLVEANSENQGSSRVLPLTDLNRYESTQSPQGIWLSLKGSEIRGDVTVTYGQVLYYHLKSQHLSSKLQWTSPAGEEPIWKPVTGGGSPELIVNQTIGLEPQFEIYQVQPQNFVQSPVALTPITLSTPVLTNPQYQSALLMARNRLWSTSLTWLQALKQRSPSSWSGAAQAQLDLIRWHAQATKTQAEGSWASPSQQILTNLIDGRWERAVTVFESSVEAAHEMVNLLKSDTGRIENRARVALRFNPTKREIKAWGALLLAAQKDQATAIAWLRKQPRTTSADIAYVSDLLQRLDPNFKTTAVSNSDRTSRIIGDVRQISRVNPREWQQLKLSPPIQPVSQPAWYQVTVMAFHDGKRWQFAESGFTVAKSLSADALWQLLGLDTNAIVQFLFWDGNEEQQTLWASVKGLRMQGGQIQLLVAGDTLPQSSKTNRLPPLALTESALQWIAPDNTTLSDWVLQQPAWSEKALPILIQELKRGYQLPIRSGETWTAMEQWGVGRWTAQTAYFTNPNQPDLILTIQPESARGLAKLVRVPMAAGFVTKPRTLIFSATGKLLYSELSTDAALSYFAIAHLAENQPAIVANTLDRYRFLRWSATRQQFE